MARRERSERLAKQESFAVETTLSGHGGMALMKRAREAGYKVNFDFVGVEEPSLLFGRILTRLARGGHDVPPGAVLRRYADSLSRLPAAMALSHRCCVLDNSGERRRLLLIRERDCTRYVSRDLPGWLRQALPEALLHIMTAASAGRAIKGRGY